MYALSLPKWLDMLFARDLAPTVVHKRLILVQTADATGFKPIFTVKNIILRGSFIVESKEMLEQCGASLKRFEDI